MTKAIILTLTFFSLFNAHLIGQNFLDRLNALPPSIVVKAPEFDVDKKFVFSIDSLNKVLIVQELSRKPDTREFNIIQIIYEIPLNDLSAGSFRAAKDPDNQTLFNFKIGTIKNKQSIIQYWLSYDEVILIKTQDLLSIGNWLYSEQLESELRKIIPMIAEKLSDKSYSTNLFHPGKSVVKYHTSSVVGIKKVDSVKPYDDGYYYAASLKNPPSYSKNNPSSNGKLLRNIKTELKRDGIELQKRNPVFIRVDANGAIESIFFPDLSMAENKKIELKNFEHLIPGNDSISSVKSKFLLILK